MLNHQEAVRQNMLQTFRFLSGNNPHVHIVNDQGGIRFETELPFPLFNRVFEYQTQPHGNTAEDIKAIAATYQQRGFRCGWHTYSHDRDEGVEQALEINGFSKVGSMSGMALHLEKWDTSAREREIEGLQIGTVQSEEELEIFKQVFIAEYQLPVEVAEAVNRIYALKAGGDKTVRYYLASFKGEPAGTLMTYSSGDIGGIYTVATLKPFRNKGIGSALVSRALNDLKADGIRLAVLQASAMGQGLYARLGFEEVITIDVYSN